MCRKVARLGRYTFKYADQNRSSGNGCQVTLTANDRYELCPVRAVANYRSVRSRGGSAFFCNFDRTPLTRQQFSSTLKRAVAFCGLPVTFYSSHSFRIGAATTAAMSGVPEVRIQTMGRWSTDTHKIFIRPTLSFPSRPKRILTNIT